MEGFKRKRIKAALPNQLSDRQRRAAQGIFRDAADEDYVVARLMWKNLIIRQFYWSASQAIEKYLKAAILCNLQEFSSSPIKWNARFSHNWIRQYEAICELALRYDRSVPDILTLPTNELSQRLNRGGYIYDEPTNQFVERVHENGQPRVRYNTFSWIDAEPFDLHKLDTLVRWLRGLCFPLNETIARSESQDDEYDPSLAGFKRLLEHSPVAAEANYAFFPESKDEPILWVDSDTSAITLLILGNDADVIAWLRDSMELKDRDWSEILRKVEASQKRGAQ